jgi:hypothetical protein
VAVAELVVAVELVVAAAEPVVVAAELVVAADLRERFFGFEPTIIVSSTVAKMYKKIVSEMD